MTVRTTNTNNAMITATAKITDTVTNVNNDGDTNTSNSDNNIMNDGNMVTVNNNNINGRKKRSQENNPQITNPRNKTNIG